MASNVMKIYIDTSALDAICKVSCPVIKCKNNTGDGACQLKYIQIKNWYAEGKWVAVCGNYEEPEASDD